MKKVILLLLLIQFYSVVNSQEKRKISRFSFNHIALSKNIKCVAQFYTNVLNLEIIPSSQKYDDVKWISLGEASASGFLCSRWNQNKQSHSSCFYLLPILMYLFSGL
jgi:hypothetical protein